MGGTTLIKTATGRCVKEEFNRLVEEAIFMYGNSPYNGSISTTSLNKEIKSESAEILKELKSSYDLEKYDSILYSDKRETNYIKELIFYRQYKPAFVQLIANQKNVKGYAIRMKDGSEGRHLKFNNTLAEAKTIAKEQAIELGKEFEIFVKNKSDVIQKYADVLLEETDKTSKSKLVKKNTVYLPNYKFYFFCYVSE